MKNFPLLIITMIGTIALIIGVAALFSQSAQQAQEVDQALVKGTARLAKGPATAKATIVEFSDFQCPACKSSQADVQRVVAAFPNDVQVVYRHYPLVQIHPYAQLAAQAAETAAEQGKFWQMHDKLFETQEQWSKSANSEAFLATLGAFATELGIDKVKFMERIQSDDIKQRVNLDVADGNKVRINSTPTFYVNGKPVAAGQLLETVRQIVETK